MTCRTETKTIDNVEYSVRQWPAEKAMVNKFKLIKILGAPLASIANVLGDSDTNDGSLSDNEVSSISGAIEQLFANSSPEDLVSFIKECIVSNVFAGEGANATRITETSFNDMFAGDDLSKVYKVFIFVIKVNYSNLVKGQGVENLLAKLQG